MRDSTDRQIAELIRVTAPNASRPVMSRKRLSALFFLPPRSAWPDRAVCQVGEKVSKFSRDNGARP